jgi:hypothetical protein
MRLTLELTDAAVLRDQSTTISAASRPPQFEGVELKLGIVDAGFDVNQRSSKRNLCVLYWLRLHRRGARLQPELEHRGNTLNH